MARYCHFNKIIKGPGISFQCTAFSQKHVRNVCHTVPGPILESRGHPCDFSENGQKRQKSLKKDEKGQDIWKIGQKYTKLENILKKGRWFCAIIACSKLLERPWAH